MNLKRARYIMAIQDAGSITAAAKKLFISQPSLSQTVRLVEQELGVAVLEHGTYPPKLTYAGEQYVAAARAMIVQEENLNNILSEIRHEERGRLRIGVSIQRGMQLLPLVLPGFTRMYPEVELLLEERGSEILKQLVDEGNIDLALATTEPSNTNLEYILIESEIFGLLVGKSNPLASRHEPGAEIDLSTLDGEPFVSLKHGHSIRTLQDRYFSREGISPRILLETDSVEAAIRITAACGCCMLCPMTFVRSNPAISGRSVFYRVKNEDYTRHFYACYRRGKYLPQYALSFIDMVREATAKSAGCEESPKNPCLSERSEESRS